MSLALGVVSCAREAAFTACPARQTDPAPAAAMALEERLAALADAGGTVAITITEDEAGAYLRYRVLSDVAVEPRVTLGQEAICVQADVRLLGRKLPVVAELVPETTDGHLQVALTTLSANGRRMPTLLRRSLQSTLNELLAELGGPAIIRSATLRDRSLTLLIELPASR